MFLLIWGCDKEDDLTPSGHEKEWMIIEDSDDPLDKLRYEIFRDYGVPTYYNATSGVRSEWICWETRTRIMNV